MKAMCLQVAGSVVDNVGLRSLIFAGPGSESLGAATVLAYHPSSPFAVLATVGEELSHGYQHLVPQDVCCGELQNTIRLRTQNVERRGLLFL